MRTLPLLAVGLALVAGPALADPARDAILAEYLTQARASDPGFSGFSAARGDVFFHARTANAAEPNSCTTCHTADPTAMGRHYKTGRAIEPVAVSKTPKRFTDKDKVERRFQRDCKKVLGRECTAAEKGDYITFLSSR